MKFRKIISLVLVLCMVTMMPVFATKEPAFDYDVAYRWAIDAGFPKEFIDTIDETFLEKIYYDNKDASCLEVDASCAYYQENAGNSTRGNIDSAELAFWIVGGKVVAPEGYIISVNLYVHYDWSEMPIYGLDEDAITVNWDDDVWKFMDDSFSATFSNLVEDPYDEIAEPATGNQGGIGWYCPFSNPNYGTPHGRAAFKLEPKDADLPSGNDNRTSVIATYAHSTVEISNINLSCTDVGVTISGSYDHITDTYTATYGDF